MLHRVGQKSSHHLPVSYKNHTEPFLSFFFGAQCSRFFREENSPSSLELGDEIGVAVDFDFGRGLVARAGLARTQATARHIDDVGIAVDDGIPPSRASVNYQQTCTTDGGLQAWPRCEALRRWRRIFVETAFSTFHSRRAKAFSSMWPWPRLANGSDADIPVQHPASQRS